LLFLLDIFFVCVGSVQQFERNTDENGGNFDRD